MNSQDPTGPSPPVGFGYGVWSICSETSLVESSQRTVSRTTLVLLTEGSPEQLEAWFPL